MIDRQVLIDDEMRSYRVARILDRYPERNRTIRGTDTADDLAAFAKQVDSAVVAIEVIWVRYRQRTSDSAVLPHSAKRESEGIIDRSKTIFTGGPGDGEKVRKRKVCRLDLSDCIYAERVWRGVSCHVIGSCIAVAKIRADRFIKRRKRQRLRVRPRNRHFRRIVDDADREGARPRQGKVFAVEVGDMHQRREIKKQGFFQMPVRRRAGIGRVNRMIDFVEQLKVVSAIGMDRKPENLAEAAFSVRVSADNGVVAGDRRVDGAVVQLVAGGLHNRASAIDNRRIGNRCIDGERQRRIAVGNEVGQRVGAVAVKELGRYK